MYYSLQWIDATNPDHSRWWLIYATRTCTDSRTWLAMGQSCGWAIVCCYILAGNCGTIRKVKTEHSWLSGRRQICCTPWSKYTFTVGRWTRIYKLLVMIFQMTFQWSGIAVALVTSNVFALVRLLTRVNHYVTISIRHSDRRAFCNACLSQQ